MDCARGVFVFSLRAFFCLKQDGQECQDCQDGAAQERGAKVWKTLMSIDISRKQGEKVREDLNVQRRLGVHARDRPSRYGYRGVRFFSVPCEGQALALR